MNVIPSLPLVSNPIGCTWPKALLAGLVTRRSAASELLF